MLRKLGDSMNNISPSVLSLMIGSIESRKKDNGNEFKTAIQKKPIKQCKLTKEGILGDEQADKKHHGGIDKAILMFSDKSYTKINKHFNSKLSYENNSAFGENIVVSHLNEENVYIGSRFKIGQTLVEIAQPREPCWKLSENTNNKKMLKFIIDSGLTGWYCRVIEEGTIKQGNQLELIYTPSLKLSVMNLNHLLHSKLLIDDPSLKSAIEFEQLGNAFKKALVKKLNN